MSTIKHGTINTYDPSTEEKQKDRELTSSLTYTARHCQGKGEKKEGRGREGRGEDCTHRILMDLIHLFHTLILTSTTNAVGLYLIQGQ